MYRQLKVTLVREPLEVGAMGKTSASDVYVLKIVPYELRNYPHELKADGVQLGGCTSGSRKVGGRGTAFRAGSEELFAHLLPQTSATTQLARKAALSPPLATVFVARTEGDISTVEIGSSEEVDGEFHSEPRSIAPWTVSTRGIRAFGLVV